MAGLTAVGECSYNGYVFAGATSVKVNIEVVKDDARRTQVYNRYTIEVRAIIQADAGTDSTLQSIRVALTKQGGPLKLVNRGLGSNLQVNCPGSQRDMKWGPVPEVISWESLGSSQACEIVWRVTACIPDCNQSLNHKTTGIIAFNYSCDFSINEKGFTTRTATGYLEIGMTRVGLTVPDCADLYRDTIVAFAPVNFQRRQSYNVSLDKSRLDFTIVDTELESRNPWPQNVVKIEARHRASISGGLRGAVKQRNSITANIELIKDANPVEAWVIFRAICLQRINVALNAQQTPNVFIEELSAEEDIFGYGASFSLTYRVLQDPTFLLANSGLWTPVGYDWGAWQYSMQGAFRQRGTAGLILSPQNDAIVDICGATTPTTMPATPALPSPPPAPATSSPFTNPKPQPQASYRSYSMFLKIKRHNRRVKQHRMQGPEIPNPYYNPRSTDPPSAGTPGTTSSAAATIQQSGRGGYTAELIGTAERVGYEIPRPALVQVGTQIPVEGDMEFVCGATGNYFGQPLYGAAWRLQYDLPDAPGPYASLENVEQNV